MSRRADFLDRILPAQFVDFVPMRASEIGLVAGWIRTGRAEAVFRGGAGPTAQGLRAHQRWLAGRSDVYLCFVLHVDGEPAGYIDLAVTGSRGELLGLYVEPKHRQARLGSFALRYGMAVLRDLGARSVTCEVYASNRPSLSACQRVGFAVAKTVLHAGDREPFLRLERRLPPWPHVGGRDPSYGRLTGRNLVRYHAAVADTVADELRRMPGVEMVLGLGSLARGFGDIWSDVDLGVLARGEHALAFWRGERWIAGVSVDLYVVDLDAVPPGSWDSARRQAFEESLVLHPATTAVAGSFRRSIRLRPDERRAETLKLLFQMAWLGFMPRAWLGRTRHGYTWVLPPDLWVTRGSVPSAHVTIDRVVDMLLQVAFLLNGRLVPDAKWRRFLAEGLDRVPRAWLARLESIEEARRTRSGFQERKVLVLDLLEDVVALLRREGVVGGDLYARFLRDAPDYDPRA